MSKSQAGGAFSTERDPEKAMVDDRTTDAVARRFPYLYAYMITGFTFLFILVAILGPAFLPKELPERSWRVIDTVLGFLLGVGVSAILQFFYGSSQWSRTKDERLTALAGRAGSGSPALAGSSARLSPTEAMPSAPDRVEGGHGDAPRS